MRLDCIDLEVSNLDKAFWPEEELTKRDLLAYFFAVAPALIPHLAGRPLVLTRYPDGIQGKSFYQKNCPDHAPSWVRTWGYYTPHSDRVIDFILCGELETLLWLANQAAIEIHPWLSTIDRPDEPDLAVFDLDPAAPADFEDAREIAFLVKEVLVWLGLRGYPKTSGATGIHIYLPLCAGYTYEETGAFVRSVAELLLRVYPDRVTQERTVARRTGKVYIDYLQNIKGKTLVGPYIPRPLPGAPVSAPVTWAELERIVPGQFNLRTMPGRVDQEGDLFAPVLTDRQSIDAARERLGQGGNRH